MEQGEQIPGVHALGQVIFDLPKRGTGEAALPSHTQTPEDIDFVRVEQVADDYSRLRRTQQDLWIYRGLWSSQELATAAHYPYPLDVEKMQAAIKSWREPHDFSGFTASGTSVEEQGSYGITEARLIEDAEHHRRLYLFGQWFLYKQIRNMVGTLLKIGNDRMPIEQIDSNF